MNKKEVNKIRVRYNRLINKGIINHFDFARGCDGISRRTIERFRDGTTSYLIPRSIKTLEIILKRIEELEK